MESWRGRRVELVVLAREIGKKMSKQAKTNDSERRRQTEEEEEGAGMISIYAAVRTKKQQ